MIAQLHSGIQPFLQKRNPGSIRLSLLVQFHLIDKTNGRHLVGTQVTEQFAGNLLLPFQMRLSNHGQIVESDGYFTGS